MIKRNKFIPALVLLVGLFFQACNDTRNEEAASKIKSEGNWAKADSVLALMNLEEKIGQLNLYNGFWDVTGPTPKEGNGKKKYEDIKNGRVGAMLNITSVERVREAQKIAVENSRLKIPMLFGFDIVHGYQTMMPIPLAESCTWDPELIKKGCEVASLEGASAGVNWAYGPVFDISHDARWGRVMETAGEDPYLGSKIAQARVAGLQGDLNSETTLAACAKHFAGYGFAEAGRDYNNSEISMHTMHNMVLPPFKAASDAGIATFMNGFQDNGGLPVTADPYLQREILKGKWGFEGFVVSDWASIQELTAHGVAADSAHAAELALKAGSDMDMEGLCYLNYAKGLVEQGKVKEATIDEAVRRILKVKFDLGLFDDPYKYCNEEREKANLGKEEHLQIATDAAKEAIVLLKNDQNMLPLKKEQSIAIIGPLAADKDSPLGSWRGRALPNSAISVVEGIENELGSTVPYAKGCELVIGEHSFTHKFEINNDDTTGFKEAVQLAKGKDVVVMVLGEDCFQSGEGRSRTEIELPGVQLDLLKEVYKVNQNIVLVLMNGRPLALPWETKNIPAIVESWHLGNGSGTAIADVLFGNHNPSGKLTMSFPHNAGQCPIFYNKKSTGRPNALTHDTGMTFYSRYIDAPTEALYPFGYGLSYTTFQYSNLRLSKEKIGTESSVEVSVDLKNTGEVTGTEVVQLYIDDVVSTRTRPVKELKGFKKMSLEPGETKRITLELTPAELGFYLDGEFVVEPGKFEIFVGTNSTDLMKTELWVE